MNLPVCDRHLEGMAMECKTCDALLAKYQQAVGLYGNAAQRFQGESEDDFQLALKELKRLKQACNDAEDALVKHYGLDHPNPAATML